MFWMRTPKSLYFKKGSMPVAFDELCTVYNRKRAFIVSGRDLYKNGQVAALEKLLDKMGIQHICYYDIDDMASFETISNGSKAMMLFEPDALISFGGRAVIDAAKIMRVCCEQPGIDIVELSEKFSDITARDNVFPEMNKVLFVAVPTMGSKGSEISPYAVIDNDGDEIVIADYNIMPDITVVDGDNMLEQTTEVVAESGLTALTQAINSYDAENATEYTDGFVIKAVQGIVKYLAAAYRFGKDEPMACEKLAEAMTMAGIAYSNTKTVISVESTFEYLADVIRINSAESENTYKRYCELSTAAGLGGQVEDLIFKIEEFVSLCGYENKKLQCD